jgi:hypothetical protein
MIMKQYVRVWTGIYWLRAGSRMGSCEHGNELSGSINDREFLNQLSDYQLLKKDSASWN